MADIKEEELEDYNPDIITLEDDEGNEYSFEVIDAADFNDKRYLAVVPYADGAQALEEDAELVIMRVGNDGEGDEGEFLDVVEDEDELAEIGAKFAERLSDLYDIDSSELI